jgi:sugar transferase (PEP-CTERM/EpsH1 system associated)
MRILTLALGIPFPPIGGGLTRTFHLLKSLAFHHEVVLVAFEYGEHHDNPPYPLQLETVPWQWSDAYRDMTGAEADVAHRAYQRLTFEDDEPWFASVFDPGAMEATIAEVLKQPVDIVLIEGTPLARFLPVLPRDVPCVLDLFDVHSVMTARALDRASPGDRAAAAREAERTLLFERRAAQRCAACLAVSEQDAAAARTMLGARRVHVVPNGVDTCYFSPSAGDVPAGAGTHAQPFSATEPGAVVFTGRMSYEPNVDAACYFAEDVLPLVRSQVPHARFHIVGASPLPRVAALASDAVVVHGRVDDVRPYLWRSEVAVVPVRVGGGTRLKVLEAAAAGKATVSTSLGVEGLPFRPGHDLLVADSTDSFADAVVTLLNDASLRAMHGERARSVALRYDWSAIGESFRAVLERLGQKNHR